MSKNIFKKIAVYVLAVALIVPGFVQAFANPTNMSGHPSATDPNARGSITVHIRTLTVPSEEMPEHLPPGTPLTPEQGVPVEGVPVRVSRVTLTNFDPEDPTTHPTAANLANPAWIAANTTPFLPAHNYTAFTNAAGTVVFGVNAAGVSTLPQGIWLVEQLDSHNNINNPIPRADRFAPFLVGIPTHIGEDSDYGDYRLDVEVWPKIDRERLHEPGKEATSYFDNIITWEFGVNIPNTIGTARDFYLLDVLDPRLTFNGANNVTGRFSTEVTGEVPNLVHTFGGLTRDTHYTVSLIHAYVAGQGYRDVVRIALTREGIAHIFAEGALGDGRLYFTMETTIEGNVHDLGEIRNEAQWRFNPTLPWCPVDDPNYPECDEVPPCPVDDPDCYSISTRLRTLGLNILKLSVADRQRLQGAVFHLYREVSEEEAATIDTAFLNTDVTPNVWMVPLRTADGSAMRGTTAANGELQFNGIVSSANSGNLSGMFWLREVTPPTGFQIIEEWMPVRVEVATVNYRNETNPYALGTLTPAEQTLRDANDRYINNVVHVNVYNERSGAWQLPETGATQTIILTIIGVTLLGSALVLKTVSKKRRKNNSAA